MRRAARLLAASTVAATAGAFTLNLAGVANPNPLPASGSSNAATSKPRHSASRAAASGALYGSSAASINGGGERADDERRSRVLTAGGAWTDKGSRRRKLARGGGRGAGGVGVEASAGVGVGVGEEEGAGGDGGRVWNKCTERVELGTSGLMVSRIGFGGIMIGGQMDEEQTHTVLNHAFDKAGINWLDTSESFPHPLIPEHKHKADPIVGSWLKGRDRSKVILCTKVAGRHEGVTWLRKDGTHPRLSRDHILESVYGSLERMDTDYIDMLYLGDWPDRLMVNPGEYYYKTSMEHELALDFEEQLMIVQELKDQGLVRHVAVANEGAFGVTRMCEHAIWDDLPKIACVQQEYNLFTQNKVEMDLVEACAPRQENVAIIATQTLGGGALSTKYMYERNLWDRKWDYRLNKFAGFQARYNSPRMREKTIQYKNIAEKYGLTIHQLAMAFVHNKPFITAALMGATNVEQIDQNVGALDVILPEECLAEIITVQDSYLEPMLGGSMVIPMRTYYEDKTRDYGHVDDESAKFWDRVTEDYTGP